MDRNSELKAISDRILFGFNLFDYLHTLGKSHVIGSYKMNIMAIPDLDIAVENDDMSLDKLYSCTNHVLMSIRPSEYKAYEKSLKSGKKEWYLSFKKELRGELFNVDICFISKEKIEAIQQFCEKAIGVMNSQQIQATMQMKQELFAKGLYDENHFTSIDVYDAVINKKILTTEQFLNERSTKKSS